MNVRRRLDEGTTSLGIGSAPRNASSTRREAVTQVKPVKNAHNKPKSVGVGGIKNAVSGNKR